MLLNAAPCNVTPLNTAGQAEANPLDRVRYLTSQTAFKWRDGNPVGAASQIKFGKAAALGVGPRIAVRHGQPLRTSSQAAFRGARPLRISVHVGMAEAAPLWAGSRLSVRQGERIGVAVALDTNPANRRGSAIRMVFRESATIARLTDVEIGKGGAIHAPTRLLVVPAEILARPQDLWFRLAHRPGPGTRKQRRPPDPPVWHDGEPSVPRTLTLTEYFNVDDTCAVTRVDDGTPIECKALSISSDMQSFSRRFTGQVFYRDIDKIRTHNGPVEIQIAANGVIWRAVITSYQDNRQFGQDSASFTAVSRSIALAKPYAVMHTGINATAATAQQLALGLLDFTGWTLGWHLGFDWLIPVGGFSLVDASAIDGIKMIANAVGGFVQTDLSNLVLHVRKANPVKPWELPSATPDIVIPVDAATVVAGEWVESPRINGVWVSGQQAGVCALVRRAGTAGDVLAPMVVDPLLTEQAANAARGIAVLAGSGPRQPVSLTLGIYPEIGIIEPGQIVQVNDGAYTWKGVCQSSSIAIAWEDDGLAVRQTPIVEHWYG